MLSNEELRLTKKAEVALELERLGNLHGVDVSGISITVRPNKLTVLRMYATLREHREGSGADEIVAP